MVKFILLLVVSVSAQQIYENRSLNAIYEAPAGWVFDPPDTNNFGTVTIKPNRVGLNPALLNITLYKFSDQEKAFYYPSADAFLKMAKFYGASASSSQAPTATLIEDTAIGTVHFCTFVLKQVDLGVIQVFHGASNQVFAQTYTYATTILDYNANSNIYGANWTNLAFISTSSIPTAMKPAATASQATIRKSLIDILGRKIKEASPTARISIPIR